MQHKANFLNSSLFSLLLLGLLGITSCNTAMRLNVKKDDGNALAPQPRGVSIDFGDEKEPALGDTPDDNIEKIVELMKGEGTHVGTGSTALHYLALSDEVYSSSDYKQIVRLLVNQRADINVKDNGGWTPLHIAVYNKKDALVKALISSGADLTIKDKNNKTAYAIAEENKDQDTMDLLYRERDRREKLHSAIMRVYPCLKEIKHLIDLGVCVDAKDRSGNTALHWASGNGHADVVELLIGKGVKVGVRNGRGETPLSCVIRSCWRDIEKAKAIIEALIKAGADINAKNKDGNTALHRVSERGHAKMVEALIKAGADINAKNKDGNTALHWVSECGHADVVKLLINAGADINAKNKDGDTALHRVSERGHADVVKLLIKEGAKVGVRNKEGEKPLSRAVDNGHTKVVNMLLDKDKDSSQGGPESSLSILVQTISNSMHIQDEEKINREISRCEMWFYRE